jgi:hypothetical protein
MENFLTLSCLFALIVLSVWLAGKCEQALDWFTGMTAATPAGALISGLIVAGMIFWALIGLIGKFMDRQPTK